MLKYNVWTHYSNGNWMTKSKKKKNSPKKYLIENESDQIFFNHDSTKNIVHLRSPHIW